MDILAGRRGVVWPFVENRNAHFETDSKIGENSRVVRGDKMYSHQKTCKTNPKMRCEVQDTSTNRMRQNVLAGFGDRESVSVRADM